MVFDGLQRVRARLYEAGYVEAKESKNPPFTYKIPVSAFAPGEEGLIVSYHPLFFRTGIGENERVELEILALDFGMEPRHITAKVYIFDEDLIIEPWPEEYDIDKIGWDETWRRFDGTLRNRTEI